MLKKIAFSLMAALLAAGSLAGAAFAAEDDPGEFLRTRGEITQVDAEAGKFRLTDPQGSVQTFFVDETTRYHGELESLEEMQVGWKAAVAAEEQDGKLWARVVIAGQLEQLLRFRGEITEVDPALGKFRLIDQDGTVQTFFTGDRTRFGGQAGGVEDLQPGWKAGVAAREDEEGKLQARVVIAGDAPELDKSRGKVTEVDAAAGKFRIQIPDGSVETFFVDERTRYQGQLSGLDELQVGWLAGVAAKEEDGKMVAVMVIAGDPPERIRVQGTVSQVDPTAGKFRLEQGDGTEITFFTDGETSYRGKIEGVGDLEVGARAGVVAVEQADGSFLARLVVAGKPRPERQGEGAEGRPVEPFPEDPLRVPGYGL